MRSGVLSCLFPISLAYRTRKTYLVGGVITKLVPQPPLTWPEKRLQARVWFHYCQTRRQRGIHSMNSTLIWRRSEYPNDAGNFCQGHVYYSQSSRELEKALGYKNSHNSFRANKSILVRVIWASPRLKGFSSI